MIPNLFRKFSSWQSVKLQPICTPPFVRRPAALNNAVSALLRGRPRCCRRFLRLPLYDLFNCCRGNGRRHFDCALRATSRVLRVELQLISGRRRRRRILRRFHGNAADDRRTTFMRFSYSESLSSYCRHNNKDTPDTQIQ